MRLKSLIVVCALFGITKSNAQTGNTVILPGENPMVAAELALLPKKKPKPIRAELSGGVRLNSNGWSVFVDKGWVKSDEKLRDYFYDTKIFQVELSEKKHPKEIKRNNALNGFDTRDSKPFIYGKTNNFYALKLGYGLRKMIAGKPENKTVSIHWVNLGGLTLGLAKPYYVNVVRVNSGVIEDIKYTKETENAFLQLQDPDPAVIVGSSGFMKGLGETKMIPGIHAKTALHFDFAPDKKGKMALETGINFEYYTKKIELMAIQDAKPYFVDVYLSLQFGGRW